MKYNRKTLERRAAEYFTRITPAHEEWKTIQHLQPKLDAFEHLMRSKDYDEAADIANQIDIDYLLPWGYSGRILTMRQQLMEKPFKDPRVKGQNLVSLGQAYFHRGQLETAKSHFEQALVVARETQDVETEARCLNGLGNCARLEGDLDSAIELHQQALVLARKLIKRSLEASTLAELGNEYSIKGENAKALSHYEQALAIFREIRDRRSEAMALVNIGIVYSAEGKEQIALKHYVDGLKLAEEVNHLYAQQVALINLGMLYTDRGEYELALEHNKQAWSVSKRIADDFGQAYSLLCVGKAYLGLADIEKAILNLNDAARVGADKVDSPIVMNPTYYSLAQAYLVTNNLSEALGEITKALEYAIDDEDGHRAFVIHGIVLARLDRVNDATAAYEKALAESQALLNESAELYAPKYTRGIAYAGLALCAQKQAIERTPAEYLADADQAFTQAKANYAAPGVLNDARQVLQLLVPLDTTQLLPALTELLTT